MRKISTIIVLLVIVVISGFWYLSNQTQKNILEESGPTDDVVTYFQVKMTSLGAQRAGQPIEGFDAGMLKIAFPGLENNDFMGIETDEGHYEVLGSELTFVRDRTDVITSAEKTINKKGYGSLLSNVSGRLGIQAISNTDVDDIVNKISEGSSLGVSVVTAKINQEVNALGVKILPLQVLEDSRCPSDVQCIQAGTVRVRTLISSGLGESRMDFRLLGDPITTEAESIKLIEVNPGTISTKEIKTSDYVFKYEIRKR